MLIAALVGAVAVFIAAGVFVVYVFFGSSDEDDIKAATQKMVDALNNADGTALQASLCNQAKGGAGGSGFLKEFAGSLASAAVSADLAENGSYSVSVTDIHVNGDHATASVTTTRSKAPGQKVTETTPFVKEDGAWKPCPSS
jgi:hypothetical protein